LTTDGSKVLASWTLPSAGISSNDVLGAIIDPAPVALVPALPRWCR